MVENHKVIGKGMIAWIGVSRGISGGEDLGRIWAGSPDLSSRVFLERMRVSLGVSLSRTLWGLPWPGLPPYPLP